MDWLTDPGAWIALLTLTALEIVLGIDNIVFISILSDRLPEAERRRARRIGLLLAMATRVLLLLSLSSVMKLTEPLFGVFGHEFSGRDLILVVGGLFLIGKSTLEIHREIEEADSSSSRVSKVSTFGSVLVQIALLDVVFSLDSVITAIGMVEQVAIMVIAVLISVVVMILFVDAVCAFVERHPTFKVLALSFLVLIGVALLGEGLELHIPKGYLYFAMAFSVLVEIVNLKLRPKPAAE